MWSRIVVLTGAILGFGFIGPALAEAPITEALKNGDVQLDLRYRYEFVDSGIFSEDAKASTLRMRLGYKTGSYHDFFALTDLEFIQVIGAERYNSTDNGLIQFPIVADPEGTELNQALLGFTGVNGSTFQVGRQGINLDNQRFVGTVNWRQNQQTFDSFTALGKFGEKWNYFYGYVNNVNRVFGDENPNTGPDGLPLDDLTMTDNLFNVSYDFPVGKLTGYGYFLEFEDVPTLSNKSIGLRFQGNHEFNDRLKLLYTAEYADQSDYEDGAPTVDADYQFVEAGLAWNRYTFRAALEVLGGDGVYAFQTQLATLHAFNGWADRFLITPVEGLEDFYVSFDLSAAGFKFKAVYHDFSSDAGSLDFGSELDLMATRKFQEIYTVGLKYAAFDGKDPSSSNPTIASDRDVLWFWLGLKF